MINRERLFKILLSPHVTNKTCAISESLSFVVFKVALNATKIEIKKAVEMIFEVKVKNVRTLCIKGKSRRFNRIEGKTKSWKKAYIRLQKGHNINFVGSE